LRGVAVDHDRIGDGDAAGVIDHRAGGGERADAERRIVREPQSPTRQRGTAGIGVGARQYQRAVADLGQAAGAADDAGEGRAVAVCVEGAAAAVERDRAAGGEARQELQRPAAEGKAARGGTEIGVGCDCEHAGIDQRASGIAVGRREDGRAGADLRERAGSGNDAVTGSAFLRRP